MLVSEGIQRVQSAYSKGMPSDDTRLSNRHVYSKLRSVRIRILSQTISKKQMVSQWCYQPVTVTMSLAPMHECAEISSETCKVLKSTKPIPQIFTSLNRHMIQSVTSVDGSHGFGETNWETIRHNRKGRKYAQSLSEFYIKNGFLYITVKKIQAKVLLTALFNDPIAAKVYSDACGNVTNSCASYLDYDLCIDGKMEEVIIDLTKDEFIDDFSQRRDDRLNNAVDDVVAAQRRRSQDQNQNQDYNE